MEGDLFPQVQLFISCRKLKDMDFLSKSDPIVEAYCAYSGQQPTRLGQTEVIWNTLNPDFAKNFVIDFHFEIQTYLTFKV